MAGGRPTKLTKALIARAKQYIKECEANDKRSKLPTVEGLAIVLDISRETLYAWEGEGNEFSDILESLRQNQAEKLIQNGLEGRYNPTIAKMILSGKHGYVEKQATDLTTNGKDLPVPILGGVTNKGGDDE